MQCASSMAMKRTLACCSRRRSGWLPSPTSRSGDTYNIRQRSSRTLASTASRSCGCSVLFRYDAATPSTRRPSTWSFISEISGETTRARPWRSRFAAPPSAAVPASSTIAGAWKQRLLPPPVGSTTTLSRPSRMACIASRCSGRNSAKPQTRCSASSRRRSASGVLVLDVVIDKTLELGGEFVVAAAQGRDVLAVDEDRTARLLAGARQADADARRLRLPRTVDDAAHDRERHLLDAFVRHFPLGHLVADVALNPLGKFLERAARRPPASRAGGDARRERAQAERLEQLAGGVDLFAPIAVGPRRQRDANRVADALVQQHAHGRRRPHQALGSHPGFGEPEVQRLVGLLRQRAVDADQIARPRRLARDDGLILAQTALDRERRRLERRQHHAFVDDVFGRLAEVAIGVLLHLRDDKLLVERAAVDADPHRLAVVDGDLADRRELLVAAAAGADVAGIDAVLVEGAGAVRILRQQQVAVVVEVADERRHAAGVDHPLPDL